MAREDAGTVDAGPRADPIAVWAEPRLTPVISGPAIRTTTAVFTNTSVAPFRGETCDTIGGIRFGSRGLVRA